MSAAIARALHDNGHPVAWCSDGRSEATGSRAERFQKFEQIHELAAWATTVVSVIPPHAAAETAESVVQAGFQGCYVDANAIAPQTAATVQGIVERGGCSYVDGGIIGPPPKETAGSRLYLSDGGDGTAARRISALFEGSIFGAPVLVGMGPHAASALKMVFAAWTKGSAAMLLATARSAEGLGVMDALRGEWEQSIPDMPARLERTNGAVGSKAWRYIGEMLEIASAFESAGQPGGFHRAAAEVYERIADERQGD